VQKVGCAGYLCLVLAVCLLAACLLTGCGDSYPDGKPLTFTDMQLTLPGDFIDLSGEDIDADADFLYGRKTLIVKGAAEDKSKLQEMTLEQYTSLVISGNNLQVSPVSNGKGYGFTYEKAVGEELYTYVTATFEGNTNFWIFQFYCPTADLQENQPEIDMILSGITPDKE
jgi:hypothetical protein